jgi:UDP-glucose 4-epimerase
LKVLVTGGNGFIGGYVCERLQTLGHSVIVMDRSLFGGQWSDIHILPSPERGIFFADVRDADAVNEAVYHSDGVIHLAGILGTQETLLDPQGCIDVNVTGSLNVFRACELHRKKCVYITLGNHFMNNPYSISKSCAERLALMLNKERGTQIAVVRGFNVYGPRQKTGPVKKIIPTMITAALKGEPITVYGEGSQVQDMIYCTDMADILCRALLVEHGVYDRIFEAGSGLKTTVLDIAQTIRMEIPAPLVGGEIKKVPMRPGEVPGAVIVADPLTLLPLFPEGGVVPGISLWRGIKRSIRYYREQLELSGQLEAVRA